MIFNRDKFLQKCEELYDLYMEKVGRILPVCGCMLEGESFCFCVLCELYSIDIIIESGLYHGVSTEIFAKYFLDKDIKIYTIDIEVMESTRKRLQKYSNIEMISGNGCIVVPDIISSIDKDKKIAIFIDGPKHALQLALAKSIINDVEFIGLHDIGKDFIDWTMRYKGNSYNAYKEFINWNKSTFITTDNWYADKYSYMNIAQLKWLQGTSNIGWSTRNDGYDAQLHNPILKKITPRGFGLGIATREQ